MLNGLAPELEARYFPLDSLRRSPLNFVSWGSGRGGGGGRAFIASQYLFSREGVGCNNTRRKRTLARGIMEDVWEDVRFTQGIMEDVDILIKVLIESKFHSYINVFHDSLCERYVYLNVFHDSLCKTYVFLKYHMIPSVKRISPLDVSHGVLLSSSRHVEGLLFARLGGVYIVFLLQAGRIRSKIVLCNDHITPTRCVTLCLASTQNLKNNDNVKRTRPRNKRY